jgi:hypothetical protein
MDINTFILSLNKKVPAQKSIFDILQLYNTNKVIYDKLIQVIEHCNSKGLIWFHEYEYVLSAIFTGVTDFRINLTDGHIDCLKDFIIKKIPYFSLFYNNMEDITETFLDTEPILTKLIIKLIYTQDIRLITRDNFVELCKLMDKFLMGNELLLCSAFVSEKNNIQTIIYDQLQHNNIDNVVQLYNIFSKVQQYDGKNVGNKILNSFCQKNQNIFVFDNWPRIFSPMQQITAIKVLNKYELLNDAGIKAKDIIPVLMDVHYKNDFYYKIANCIDDNSSDIQFLNGTQYYTRKEGLYVRQIFLITNYFPIFAYLELKYICTIDTINTANNSVIIKNNFYIPKLTVGTKIIIGNININQNVFQDSSCYFTITDIIACYNYKKFSVKKIKNVNKHLQKMEYELFLNKNIGHVSSFKELWTIKSKTYETNIS